MHAAVKHTFGVDRDSWVEFALIEATGFLARTSLTPRCAHLALNKCCNSPWPGRITTTARVTGFALVRADENVPGEFGHRVRSGLTAAGGRLCGWRLCRWRMRSRPFADLVIGDAARAHVFLEPFLPQGGHLL